MPEKSSYKLILPLLLLTLAGCTSTPERNARREHSNTESNPNITANLKAAANDVLFQAISLVGTPYRYGGDNPASGFDCSGLIQYVFLNSAGLKLPRTTAELIAIEAPIIKKDRLYPGDLVYFNTLGDRVSHVGIYVGERRFVHSPSTGGTVRMDNLDNPYWQQHYVEAKRVLAKN
jgi:cell wall-associated NlpC family hydrolase